MLRVAGRAWTAATKVTTTASTGRAMTTTTKQEGGRKMETTFQQMLKSEEGKKAIQAYSAKVIEQLGEIRRGCAEDEFASVIRQFRAELQKPKKTVA
ncbi:hypothetical protein BASA81_003300 [Batrachochytrium salamandrivorans]|nr:hypothetical protein BASA81_003300 [Batrachochytrium salamandrivorans]